MGAGLYMRPPCQSRVSTGRNSHLKYQEAELTGEALGTLELSKLDISIFPGSELWALASAW